MGAEKVYETSKAKPFDELSGRSVGLGEMTACQRS